MPGLEETHERIGTDRLSGSQFASFWKIGLYGGMPAIGIDLRLSGMRMDA
jgi:hypothetical protein